MWAVHKLCLQDLGFLSVRTWDNNLRGGGKIYFSVSISGHSHCTHALGHFMVGKRQLTEYYPHFRVGLVPQQKTAHTK